MNRVWLLALACCLPLGVLADERTPLDPDILYKTGDVALDNWPFCNFFVIHTQHGFSLTMWQSGMWIFGEGDDVYGLVDHTGQQSILLAGVTFSGRMTVNIEEIDVTLKKAQSEFYRRCKID